MSSPPPPPPPSSDTPSSWHELEGQLLHFIQTSSPITPSQSTTQLEGWEGLVVSMLECLQQNEQPSSSSAASLNAAPTTPVLPLSFWEVVWKSAVCCLKYTLAVTSQPQIRNIRGSIITLIQRYFQHETFKGHVREIMTHLLDVLQSDHEENGVAALKIIVDLHKNYKGALEEFVEPFLAIVLTMYRNLDQAVQRTFNVSATPSSHEAALASNTQASPDAPSSLSPSPYPPVPAIQSFKVLTECPIIIALLFQLHRKFVAAHVPMFIPLVVDAISYSPLAQKQAQANQPGLIGMAPILHEHRVAYGELKACQVKTVSFIAYILRSYYDLLRPYQEQVSEYVIQLMKDTPIEAAATRRELIIATRHIWYTEFKTSFVKHFDILLNQNIMVGPGVTCRESLLPLAHSVLVDLLHHMRGQLSVAQLARTVFVFSRNLNDPSFAPNIQTMCAKLLLNLSEVLKELPDKWIAVNLLYRILDAYALRFSTMAKSCADIATYLMHPTTSADSPRLEFPMDLGVVQPFASCSRSSLEGSADLLRDIKFLFKNLVLGAKTIVFAVRSLGLSKGPPHPVFPAMFLDGIGCFDFYSPTLFEGSKEDKEVLETFAALFTFIEPQEFQNVIHLHLPVLFDAISRNTNLIIIPQYFLANPAVSSPFAGHLLKFLMSRKLELLASRDVTPDFCNIVIRLFKLLFMAVTLFPDKNELMLKPSLGTLITTSLNMALDAHEPSHLFLLLRALFRSIGGGRFEALYQEVLPLLPMLLETLNNLLATSEKQTMKELFVELCLTVPVRLSVLLPYLGHLMKPLVVALNSSPDLVSQGLRTLELCIDNLTQEFLEPILMPVMEELMRSLHQHLQPLPYNQLHAHTAMRILGKLGGRNRRLVLPPALTYHDPDSRGAICLPIRFETSLGAEEAAQSMDASLKAFMERVPAGSVDPDVSIVHLDSTLDLCLDVLSGVSVIPVEHVRVYKQKAFNCIKAFLTLLMPPPTSQSDAGPERLCTQFSQMSVTHSKKIFLSLFYAHFEPDFQAEAWAFIRAIVVVYVKVHCEKRLPWIVAIGSKTRTAVPVKGASDNALVMAIAELLGSPLDECRDFAQRLIRLVSSCARQHRELSGATSGNSHSTSGSTPETIDLIEALTQAVCSMCYQQPFAIKIGGSLGISHLVSSTSVRFELDFIKALLFVLKDTTCPKLYKSKTKETLLALLQSCHSRSNPNAYLTGGVDKHFKGVLSLLIVELASSYEDVRAAVKESFELLHQLTLLPISDLLSPVKDRVLPPIFSKPLRALPFSMQIGHIDAVTYLLNLEPPLINFGDELVRLINEALALADAEDQALVSKSTPFKNASALVALRVVCLQLLTKAMDIIDFQKQASLRARIISVFFKTLYSKSNDIVVVSNSGLHSVLTQQHKLPKDLLQAGLRPILMNLSDHKRLTVAGLEGLARLLQLLTNYFKVEIGKKLLDHLRMWAESKALEEAPIKFLEDIDEVKIIVAIFNVFHLLPATAVIFLDELMIELISLEAKMRVSSCSPFRQPMLLFINRYAKESVAYFISKLDNEVYSQLFLSFLNQSPELAVEVVPNLSVIFANGFNMNSYLVLETLIKLGTDLGQDDNALFEFVRENWVKFMLLPDAGSYTSPSSPEYCKSLIFLRILLGISKRNRGNVEFLFSCVSFLDAPDVVDFSPLKEYLYEEVCRSYTPAQKQQVLLHFLRTYSPRQSSRFVNIIRFVIVPMLMYLHDQTQFSGFIDNRIVELLLSKIWKSAEVVDDVLVIELCQLSSVLLTASPQAFGAAQADIIRFAWNRLTSEDVSVKHAGFHIMSLTIRAFDTQAKVVNAVFYNLLRAHSTEGRVIAKQALDILLPTLPVRLAEGAAPGANVQDTLAEQQPIWIRYIRKVISEEGHTPSQLIFLLQLVTRHPDLLYDYGHSFIPHLVTALPKFGLTPNATAESRILAVEIGELVLNWEKRSLDASTSEDSSVMDVDSIQQRSGITEPRYIALMLAYFLKYAVMEQSHVNASPLPGRCVPIVREMLTLQPTSLVTYAAFEKLLFVEITDATIPVFLVALELISIVQSTKGSAWTLENMLNIQSLVEHVLKSDLAVLTLALEPVLRAVFKVLVQESGGSRLKPTSTLALPGVDEDDEPEEGGVATDNGDGHPSSFLNLLDMFVDSGVKENGTLHSTALVLRVIYDFEGPEGLAKYLPDIMTQLQRMVDVCQTPVFEVESVLILLQLVNHCVLLLGDQRRTFVNLLVGLAEQSAVESISMAVLDIARSWTLGHKADAFPTVKEKAHLLERLVCFLTKGDARLNQQFLDLVLQVYRDSDLVGTEITHRLEQAFLMGTQSADPSLRCQFLDILHANLNPSAPTRLHYIFRVQNWSLIGETFWIRQAADLLLGVMRASQPQWRPLFDDFLFRPAPSSRPTELMPAPVTSLTTEMEVNGYYDETEEGPLLHWFMERLQSFCAEDVFGAMRHFTFLEGSYAHELWRAIFPCSWKSLNSFERHDITKDIISCLAQEYHLVQRDSQPNVVQVILEGIAGVKPPIYIPPQLLLYLGRTFNAWHASLDLLSFDDSLISMSDTQPTPVASAQSANLDAQCTILDQLGEEDYFFGLWKRRCYYRETNLGLSYEQNGLWSEASAFYEAALEKARKGVLPFEESEYTLWETHWAQCAEKLQQWDILTDLAKHEANPERILECAWRLSDWSTERDSLASTVLAVADREGPRQKVLEAFLLLQRMEGNADGTKSSENKERLLEFTKICEDGVQSSLKLWTYLPKTANKEPLLHVFQQFVELAEASQIQSNLTTTSVANIDSKSQELRGILQTWRERLPNIWDDVNIWSDLVAWRQHVFSSINRAYLPLIPLLSKPHGVHGNPGSSYAYRGYHETAWIINRFANVARKHILNDVCVQSLSKIYTLPNIEIHEAFYKLREQAKYHLQSVNDYTTGLDVINNTNLLYFTVSQKAEFFTLKGIFLSKLNLQEEANASFSSATQIDLNLAKAWAAWGRFNDALFTHSSDFTQGSYAVNCYLQASMLHNNGKSRKIIARLLYLLSLDEGSVLMKAVDAYKGDLPLWYFVTFIPQLLSGLESAEAVFCKSVLLKLAKTYPQALHFQLRVFKDELIKKSLQLAPSTQHSAEPTPQPSTSRKSGDQTDDMETDNPSASVDGTMTESQQIGKPIEVVEEVVQLLKTAFPLLAMALESMSDQISTRLKPYSDEDVHRLIVALLTDGIQMYANQLCRDPTEITMLSNMTEQNLLRFAASMSPNHLDFKADFERDFITSKPSLFDMLLKFRQWRDRLSIILDSQPHALHLERHSHFLTEFEHQKMEEVEIPGQYDLLKDSSKDFVKILRFNPNVDILRTHTNSHRRIILSGTDGSESAFLIQSPCVRSSRREEKFVQLLRHFSGVCDRKLWTRKRKMGIHLPTIVHLSQTVRLVQDFPASHTFQDIFDDHCDSHNMDKDGYVMYYLNRLRDTLLLSKNANIGKRDKFDVLSLKSEIAVEMGKKFIPETIFSNFMAKVYPDFSELFWARKKLTLDMAVISFVCHLLSIGGRNPQKLHLSLKTGNVWMSDIISSFGPNDQLGHIEAVPFRLTPNLQRFMTPNGVDGLFIMGIQALAASCMLGDEFELDNYLGLYLKEELFNRKSMKRGKELRDLVEANMELVKKRAQGLISPPVSPASIVDASDVSAPIIESQKEVSSTTEPVNPASASSIPPASSLSQHYPSCQAILDLVASATDPLRLCQMDIAYLSRF